MNLEEVRFSKNSNLGVLSRGNFHTENRHKSKHIVFYDSNLVDIDILLKGKIDGFVYVPVDSSDDFINVIRTILSNNINTDSGGIMVK